MAYLHSVGYNKNSQLEIKGQSLPIMQYFKQITRKMKIGEGSHGKGKQFWKTFSLGESGSGEFEKVLDPQRKST